ncbi:MAG: lipid II:glycine glycyltransferase FemX [Acutalibacteraceae bacterium]
MRYSKEEMDFLEKNLTGNFMQSPYWADVKDNWIHTHITVRDTAGNIDGMMLLLIKKVPMVHTTLMYAPRGPVCNYNIDVLDRLFQAVEKVQKRYNAFMLKIDPMIEETDQTAIENLCALGFHYHPEKTGYDTVQCRENYVLDIGGKTEEEIFNNFKPKYRYNIRLAEKKGVVCRAYGAERLNDFCSLMQETGKRDGFAIRNKSYFEKMLLNMDGHCRLYMCDWNGIPLSGAIAVNYAGKTCYVYGASSNEYRNLMPNYLMQWSMIQWAVETGCYLYDFQGIPYYNDETHPNYGVYRFKQGFNGRVLKYAGEFDYIFRPVMMGIVQSALKLSGHRIL